MSKLNKFRRSTEEESVWLSISDLMSGLMIVFLFIAVAFMSRVADENIQMKKQKDTIEKVVQTYEDTKGSIYNDLWKYRRISIINVWFDCINFNVTFCYSKYNSSRDK